jgi:hypothetical protein
MQLEVKSGFPVIIDGTVLVRLTPEQPLHPDEHLTIRLSKERDRIEHNSIYRVTIEKIED